MPVLLQNGIVRTLSVVGVHVTGAPNMLILDITESTVTTVKQVRNVQIL
jgi:hypothetical protein